MQHDPESNRLHFFDGDGKAIRPCYLGAVMPLSTWGMSYMLVKMTEPFSLVRPNHLFSAPNEDDALIKPTSRIEEDDLVLFRQSWQMKSEDPFTHSKQIFRGRTPV